VVYNNSFLETIRTYSSYLSDNIIDNLEKGKNMTTVELNSLADSNIYCPKCGSLVLEREQPFSSEGLCDHVLFVAHDIGMEYVKDKSIEENYDEDKYEHLTDYLSNLDITTGLFIQIYTPAPNFFGEYIGFDFK